MILKIKDLNSFYGNSHILFDLNLEVEKGDSVCILGRNGVGKSTTMKSIIGQMSARNHCSVKGSIEFEGTELTKLRPYKIVRSGISYVPQGRMIFPTLSTKENLIISQRKGANGEDDWPLERIYDLFPNLANRENVMGNRLSGGEQQMLAIARALVQNPKLLLLDEITEGLAPIVVDELGEVIQKLRASDVSILVAEQNVKFAMAVSKYCYIIEKGTVVYHSLTKDIPKEIINEYLSA